MTAEITFWSNRQKKSEIWYNNGNLHRNDGPAYQEYNRDGILITEGWWVDGKRHCIDGPAIIRPNGFQYWFIRGNDITVQVNQWLEQNNKSYPFNKNTQILFKLTFDE